MSKLPYETKKICRFAERALRTEITFAISFSASPTGLLSGNGVVIGGAPASAVCVVLYQSIAFDILLAYVRVSGSG